MAQGINSPRSDIDANSEIGSSDITIIKAPSDASRPRFTAAPQNTQSLLFDGPLQGINRGDTFNVAVNLTFNGYSAMGVTYYLEANNSLAPFINVTGVTYAPGSPFPDPNQTTPNTVPFNATTGSTAGFLREVRDLGATVNNPGTDTVPPGNYHITDITFTLTSDAAVGFHTVRSTSVPGPPYPSYYSFVSDTNFNDNPIPAGGFQFILPIIGLLNACIGGTGNGGGSILNYASNGTKVFFDPEIDQPRGVAFDWTGHLLAATNTLTSGNFQGKILQFTYDYAVQSTFATVVGPSSNFLLEDLKVDRAGNVFAVAIDLSVPAQPSTIYKFSPIGVQSTFATLPGYTVGLAFDGVGNLYAADLADRIVYKFTPGGVQSIFIPASAFGSQSPAGLAFDKFGNLFVSASIGSGNASILKFDPSGTGTTFALGLTENPHGLGFDRTGNLFVAEVGDGSPGDILEFTPDGSRTVFASGLGPPQGGGGAQFLASFPSPVIIGSNLSASATVGRPFVYQIVATNYPTYYGAQLPPQPPEPGVLPAGLSIDHNSGIISGVPSVAGNYTIILTVRNYYGEDRANLALAVQPPPSSGPEIINSTTAAGKVGRPFRFQVLTSGASSAAMLSTSPLPAGLTADPVTGLISGTPSADGNFPVTLTVTDGLASINRFVQLAITNDPIIPVIASSDSATLVPGQFFSYTLTADINGNFSYIGTDGQINGMLPQGLTYNGPSHTISGTYGGPITPPPPDTIKIRPPLIAIGQPIVNNVNGTGTNPLNFFGPAAGSRKTGSAGPIDIALPLSGASGIECRSGGPNSDYQVVFAFASPVTFGGASVTPGPGGSGNVSSTNISSDGKEVSVNLTNVSNGQRLNVTLSGVQDGANTNTYSVAVQMGILVGDVNGNGSVNASDVGQVKSQSGQSVTASNARADVNGNGVINGADVSLVKSKAGTSLPP